MFNFTFTLGTNAGNPFTAQAEKQERIQQAIAPQTIKRKLPPPPRRPLPPPSALEDEPRSKKRGWVPTNSSASTAISQPTLTSGWIDTPAKYVAQASESHDNGGDYDMEELPPAKKRRTLADSVISTAFSAALIGTAVGMTAYRLWRDRGKTATDIKSDHLDPPPPPYEKEEWVDETIMKRSLNPPGNRSPRPPRKPRTIARRPVRQRRTPISPVRSPVRSASPLRVVSPRPEEPRENQGELENQMDWMSDKIRRLIEEGQKALGKEVVVMNDEQNNEEEGAVDDGMDGWEEENPDPSIPGPSSATTPTLRRPRQRLPKPLTINPSASSPASSYFDLAASYGSVSTSPRSRRAGYPSGANTPGTPSGLRSPYLSTPSTKLGSKISRGSEDNAKVIYEPGALSTDIDHVARAFQDEDTQRLKDGMEAVRKAYKIH